MSIALFAGLAIASSNPHHAVAGPEAENEVLVVGAMHQDPGHQNVSFGFRMQRSFGRHVGGMHISALERIGTRQKWSMFSLSAFYGFKVVDHRKIVVMPYVHAGGFVQVGLALRGWVPIGDARLGADASFGGTWELPFVTPRDLPVDDRFRQYGALPEAGAWLDLGGPLHPTVRAGVLGRDPIASVQIGSFITARGAVSYDVRDGLFTAWVGVGLRIDQGGMWNP